MHEYGRLSIGDGGRSRLPAMKRLFEKMYLTPTKCANPVDKGALAELNSLNRDPSNRSNGPDSSPPKVRSLSAFYGADFHGVIDYGGVPYHLLLQFSRTELKCQENVWLKKLYDAMNAADESAINSQVGIQHRQL